MGIRNASFISKRKSNNVLSYLNQFLSPQMIPRQILGRHAFLGSVSLSVVHQDFTAVPKILTYSAYHTFQNNIICSDITKKKGPTCTSASPIALSYELGRLLSIQTRYELYQFLKRFTINKKFNDEVHCFLRVPNLRTDFQQALNLIDTYTWNSGMEGLLMVKRSAEIWYPNECVAEGSLLPHKTLCEYMNEPLVALSKLLDKASNNVWPRAVVLSQIELLLNKIISSGSQCTVDKVNRFLMSNYCPELKGPALCSSWVSLYLSPHEKDLEIAAYILENNEHVMTPYLDETLSRVAEYLLDERQLNRYYVLLQLFSKRSHRKKMEHLLELLFRHFYKSNNFRGCSTCVSLARDLKLELMPDILFKFEVMLKGRNVKKDILFIF